MGSLTITEEIIMVVFGTISSICSITGSLMIILHLYYRCSRRSRRKQRSSNTNNSSISNNNYNYNNSNSNNKNINKNDNPATTAAARGTGTGVPATFPASHNNTTLNNVTPMMTAAEAVITTDQTTTTSTEQTTPIGFIQRRKGVRSINSNYNTMLGTTDRRILFCMSFFDIFQSITTLLQPFLLDRSYNNYFNFGYGNRTTCTAVATFHHISFAGGLYACMLNFFYLLTIRYRWPQSKIDQSKIEWFMHLVAFGWPFTCGLSGAVIGFWGNRPLLMGCWVGEYPHGCTASNGTIPCRGPLIGWMIGSVMYVFYVGSLFISNTLLYLHVRKISKKSLYWGFRTQQQLQPDLPLLPAGTTATTTATPTPNESTTTPQNTTNETEEQRNTVVRTAPSSSGIFSSSSSSSGVLSRTFTTRRLSRLRMSRGRSLYSSSEMIGTSSRGGDVSSSSVTTGIDLSGGVSSTYCPDIEEIHRKRLRRVGMQAVYYVVAGGIVYTPFFITQDLLIFFHTVTQKQVYILLLFQAIVLPLDGFFNAIIYFRPRYLDLRYNPRTGVIQRSVLDTLWICVFGESLRRRNHYKRRNQPNATESDTTTNRQQQQQPMVDNNYANEIIATTDGSVTPTTASTDVRKSTAKTNLSASVATLLDIIREEPDSNNNNNNDQTTTPNDDDDDNGEQLQPSDSACSNFNKNIPSPIREAVSDNDDAGDNNDDDNIDHNVDEGEIVFDDTCYQHNVGDDVIDR